jgi:hypothetical protein
MPQIDRAAELDLACRWHGGKRDKHQHPEGIHVAEERRLRLRLDLEARTKKLLDRAA